MIFNYSVFVHQNTWTEHVHLKSPSEQRFRLTGLSPGSRADPDLPSSGWPGAGEGQEEMKGTTRS